MKVRFCFSWRVNLLQDFEDNSQFLQICWKIYCEFLPYVGSDFWDCSTFQDFYNFLRICRILQTFLQFWRSFKSFSTVFCNLYCGLNFVILTAVFQDSNPVCRRKFVLSCSVESKGPSISKAVGSEKGPRREECTASPCSIWASLVPVERRLAVWKWR